tara:strand:- start:1529 stop:1720 length:192 start_codon:yes stop_codon:yes gene_type:complete
MYRTKDLKNIAITLISQYGDDAEAVAMLRAAEYAAELNNDEWVKWEKIVKLISSIDKKPELDG